jgi:hypothetical protein
MLKAVDTDTDTAEGHVLIENVVNIFFVTSLSVSLNNRLGKYIFIKKICTSTYYTGRL